MPLPLVTVIIPTYNRAVRIIQTLDSVLEQTYPNLEVIVVDDGSADNTLQVLNDYSEKAVQKQIKFKAIAQKNAGAPAARNNGLRNADGEYVVFFDSDDVMLPERIETQIKIMLEENSDCCACGFFINNEQQKYQPYIIEGKGILYSFLREKLFASTQSWMLKKSLVLQVGGYDETLKCRQDGDIIFRIFIMQPKVSITMLPLSIFINHNGQRIIQSAKKIEYGYNSIIRYHSKIVDYCVLKKEFMLLFFEMRRYCGDMIASLIANYSCLWQELKLLLKRTYKYDKIYRLYVLFLALIFTHYFFINKTCRKN